MSSSQYTTTLEREFNNIIKNVTLNSKLNQKSFQHNAKSLRSVLTKWRSSTTQFGSLQDWKAVVPHVDLDPILTNAYLWRDSSDFTK
jgi:hypothetical protein